ncbi:hypothetical protein GCM10025880_32280 [Methylorubrum aminovorans]|nr:hypothetical protein GCM10025880_32280 [Methylorubrum aminovorans]
MTRWRQVERSRQQSQQADPTAVDKVDPNTAEPNAGQPGAIPGRSSAYAPGSNAALDGGAADGGARPKAFDASEGTRLDPLRNKTFDLGSPKTVPALRNP